MSSGLVKRARPGRPPKSLQTNNQPQMVEKPMVVPTPTSNRKAGSMSLRPNKRVKISKSLKKELMSEDELDDEDDVIDTPDDEESDAEEYENDENDFSAVSSIKSKRYPMENLGKEELLELTNTFDDSVDSNPVAAKRVRKKIIYHAERTAKKRREQLKTSKMESGLCSSSIHSMRPI